MRISISDTDLARSFREEGRVEGRAETVAALLAAASATTRAWQGSPPASD